MLPFHLIGFSFAPKTTKPYLYTATDEELSDLFYFETEDWEEDGEDDFSFEWEENEEEIEEEELDMFLEIFSNNDWQFDEPNQEDWEEDDEDWIF